MCFVGKLDLNTRKTKLLFNGTNFQTSPDNRYIHCYCDGTLLIYDCKKEKIVRSIKPDLGDELMADVYLYVSDDWGWFTATDTITYETTYIFRYPTKGKLYYEQVAMIEQGEIIHITDKYIFTQTIDGLFHRYSFDTGKSIVVSRQDVIKKYGIRL